MMMNPDREPASALILVILSDAQRPSSKKNTDRKSSGTADARARCHQFISTVTEQAVCAGRRCIGEGSLRIAAPPWRIQRRAVERERAFNEQ